MKKSVKGKTDYRKINLSYFEMIAIFTKGIIILSVVSYLFYKSVAAFVILLPSLIFFVKIEKHKLAEQKRKNLQKQFKDGITVLVSGLEAGYSVENVFADACEELRQMYQKETDIEREFRLISNGVTLNEPIETMVLDFANRSGLEDVRNFAQVFIIAKRRGGDLIMILKSSINTIQEKLEVKQEIDTLISGKKLEQNIMSIVPLAILLYVNLTSPEFVDGLYRNIVGVTVMSACLLVYIFSVLIGRKIVEVEV